MLGIAINEIKMKAYTLTAVYQTCDRGQHEA